MKNLSNNSYSKKKGDSNIKRSQLKNNHKSNNLKGNSSHIGKSNKHERKNFKKNDSFKK